MKPRLPLPLFVAGFFTTAAIATAAEPPQWSVRRLRGVTVPGLPPVAGHVHIDQFGYLAGEQKVAVISDPQRGFNAGDAFAPGPTMEIRRVADGAVVFAGVLELFDGGKTDATSGDRGWWFDFSGTSETGDYYVYDPKQQARSHVFRIAPDVYADVLRAAVRVFYYQREATAHIAPWAEAPWHDGPSFLQDKEARAVWAKDDPATARDLSGGWQDAGDTNKYPTFLGEVIHPLLYAWRANPAVFTDDFNIPESGNGGPDLLDEVKWELDWLVKMQDDDGGVFIKMGMTTERASSPLSADRHPRYYGPKCSASTITTAGVFAHAARVFDEFDAWRDFATELRQRAQRAWHWYQTNPRRFDCDSGEIRSGDADLDNAAHDRVEAVAAMHLWVLTGESVYHDAFARKVGAMRQLAGNVWSSNEMGHAEVLVDYLAQAGADPAIRTRITEAYAHSMRSSRFMPQDGKDELYRAWMPDYSYHWGSNRTRAAHGLAALAGVDSGLGGAQRAHLRQRALNLLHALHGVNPLDVVYLTNMGGCGAESSVTRVYHEWFGDNPPPGYLAGGPNPGYTGTLDWLHHQPPAKAYADFNTGHPANSWEITEPAIYYQATYVRLLSAFVGRVDAIQP